MTTKRWKKGLRYPENWKEISNQTRDGAGRTCQHCGARENLKKKFYLRVHHLNGDPFDNRPGNLNVVCLRCHNKAESRSNFKQLWFKDMRPEWVSERELYFQKLIYQEDFD